MKRLFFLFGLILIIVSCQKHESAENVTGVQKLIPCIPSNLSSNVIAFYPFSHGSLNDVSGNNCHLTNSTSASSTTDRNGNDSCAFEFHYLSNSNEFLTTSNTNFLNGLQEFSVSLWYQPLDTNRNGANYESLVSRDSGRVICPDKIGQWTVGLYDCRRACFGRTSSVWDNLITNYSCQNEINARTNIWAHLVATFKNNSLEMKIYRNGVLQDVSWGSANCGIYQEIGNLFIGKGYTGKIDDIIIFNRAITSAEVFTLYNMGTCCQ